MKILYWMTRDLRLHDNPALAQALGKAQQLLCVAFDTLLEGERPLNPHQKWWRSVSLKAFSRKLKDKYTQKLNFLDGNVKDALLQLCQEQAIDALVTSAIFEPAYVKLYEELKLALQEMGVELHVINSNYLINPKAVLTPKGTVYKVYTPFKSKVKDSVLGCDGTQVPKDLNMPVPIHLSKAKAIDVQPTLASVQSVWEPGEEGALRAWNDFQAKLPKYGISRDLPAEAGTSRLSPHLHFGEISPRFLVLALEKLKNDQPRADLGVASYLNELIWREFAMYTIFHHPHMVSGPYNSKFEHFPWEENPEWRKAWQEGKTGVPLVDAGIQELLTTGWMHNRVRMVVASLLTKNMNISWRTGEQFFWAHLVDADLAANVFNWQWVAGCGTDAAPFFRIFNPLTQAEKFDPDGEYCAKWAPYAAGLEPVVDLRLSRNLALERFKALA